MSVLSFAVPREYHYFFDSSKMGSTAAIGFLAMKFFEFQKTDTGSVIRSIQRGRNNELLRKVSHPEHNPSEEIRLLALLLAPISLRSPLRDRS